MPNEPVLVTASFEKGRGSGHLARCGLLVRELRRLGREAILYLPGLGSGTGRTLNEARAVLSQVIEDPDEVPIALDEAELRRNWAIVVFDRFATPVREFERFAAPSIGIDEGGRARPRFDFLLDLLPGLPSLAPPNDLRPGLLCLPSRRKDGRAAGYPPLKILVTFGGEDAAKLGLAAARACSVPGLGEVTLVSGALNRIQKDSRCDTAMTRIPFVKNLRDKLADYDLVVTHFGLCAFEALYANVPVLLVSPTRLHERLARSAGFVSAGRGVSGAARLAKLLFTAARGASERRLNTAALAKIALRCGEAARRYGLDAEQRETLAAYIDRMAPKTSPVCPLCAYARPVVAGRFAGRTYRRCPRCGTLYMNRSEPPDIRYTEAYFFENYKKQYGKTYLEDFPNLTAMARRRLAVIKRLAGNCNGRRLLDIGCAYGAFAAAARGEGFDCVGMDGSAAAASYAQNELQITAFQGFFPEAAATQEPHEQFRHKFDVITLWYVIEHFETARAGGSCAVKTALEKIHGLLNLGGILAFSTPNLRGVSGRLSLRKFLEKSPTDHWTIWSGRSVKKVLPRFGFAIKRIVVTGHHPERFPFCSRLAPRSFAYKVVMALSVIFRLGDTFEVYAEKREG
ncbi:MAG: methyltransferase domain-containing protein [Spirochaetaceae bacterium]|jgi:2-polyprenyl-3-methyl-5-hydroxy-6-metoxy-1,4-benzoquinol methylase|nr:methyltransferase domain-containing protein [Spirochaetaceae bacterium]